MHARRYRVVVTREDDAWLARVTELPGASTFARDLAFLDGYVREVIALMLDLPDGAEAGLNVAYEYDLEGADLAAAVAQLGDGNSRDGL
jgi:predicted RNase H-like HicB family nuclease